MYLEERIDSYRVLKEELFYFLIDRKGNIINSRGRLVNDGVFPKDGTLIKVMPVDFLSLLEKFIESDNEYDYCKVSVCRGDEVLNLDLKLKKTKSQHFEISGKENANIADVGLVSLDKLPFPVAIAQKSGELLMFNSRFIDFFLGTNTVLRPLFIQDVIQTNYYSPEVFEYDHMIKSVDNSHAVLCNFKGDSYNQTFVLNVLPHKINRNKLFIITVNDITHFIEVQQSLEDQNEELKRQVQEEYELNRSYEIELLKKNRLESLGQIASGIFHELNQPLTHLSLKIDNMVEKWRNGEIKEEYVELKAEQIQRQILRMRGIIDEMKQFSSLSEQKDQIVNVKEILNKALEDVSYLNVGGLILSIKQLDDVFVEGTGNELEQVFVNVLTNSIQALRLKQKNDIDFSPKLKIFVHKKDNLVSIHFVDNGVGIKEEIKAEVFKPFFTTRKDEGGSGLGLFIVNNIMRKMKGTISIKSRECFFCKITLMFPVVK